MAANFSMSIVSSSVRDPRRAAAAAASQPAWPPPMTIISYVSVFIMVCCVVLLSRSVCVLRAEVCGELSGHWPAASASFGRIAGWMCARNGPKQPEILHEYQMGVGFIVQAAKGGVRGSFYPFCPRALRTFRAPVPCTSLRRLFAGRGPCRFRMHWLARGGMKNGARIVPLPDGLVRR